MVITTLRVTDDDVRSTEIFQHRRRHITCVRTTVVSIGVLCTQDQLVAAFFDQALSQIQIHCWWRNDNINTFNTFKFCIQTV
ncbi:Uncharacterised protein [Vibrio cholerae]|uniref:Uncharacterized protein n=1 Tax=Vibrio cholerae TaxID=666 RepID=A0A655PWJ9_VIBCL|nr:Uncharacterised protein [Vibrio cholerae]CSB00635.1 Uncharacterised protein [Vibrio cholerae]CSB93445.1 Uncharacterised protein [Vibrio cholerae]CSC02015.1 Uncharacterised protein [Vibrio cholerae]CSC66865.1 Uncharacterised protein [Vibrio cholerae]